MTPLPPIYCISCTQHPDRRTWAVRHHRDTGLDVTLWDAFHGKTWGLKPTAIHAGHVGNNMSHWALWQHCYLSCYEEVLILEDDCRFVPNFRERYAALRANTPPDWQVLTVGYCGQRGRHDPVNEYVCTSDKDESGMHCYLVRRSALPVLMANMQTTANGIDQLMWQRVFQPGLLAWYVARQSLAGQMTCDGGWASVTDDRYLG
jgi:Glycosyltransferase family 25 (LPS biosynthesis protein)